jgi:16S rRNA (guanine527-N7)-methyltransferase
MPTQNTLADELAATGMEFPVDQIEQLDAYRKQLWDWNEKLNLTRHTTLEKFVTRDVFDSLELSKLIDRGQRVLDMGTGGGVPGLILAIIRPDLKVNVCESVGKKARAVEAIVTELALPVTVFPSRAEDVLELTTVDTIVARGVAPLRKILTWLGPHWDAFDQILLIKGRSWIEERGEARHHGLLKGLELRKASNYTTPRTDAESVILRISRPSVE